ncbi:MAG: hypothetical protein MZV63_05720 [Marinilabiliales bacterium]|nr:hypothetical protein [Marinilabiliales bacterium]
MHYCPGCGHGTVHSVLAEVIEEEDLQSRTIGISPVGCSVLMYNYLDVDYAGGSSRKGACPGHSRKAAYA